MARCRPRWWMDNFLTALRKNFTSEDFRFTTAGGYLYATALKCSDNGTYCIKSLGEQDASKQANFHGIIKKSGTAENRGNAGMEPG